MTGLQRKTISELALKLGARISKRLILAVLFLSSALVLTHSVLHYKQQGNFFVRGMQGYIMQLIQTNDFFELNRNFKSFLKDQAFSGAWLYRDVDNRLMIHAIQESVLSLDGNLHSSDWWFSVVHMRLYFYSRYRMMLSQHDLSYTLVLAQKINLIPVAVALALIEMLVLFLNAYIRRVLGKFSQTITQPLQSFIGHLRGITSAEDFYKFHAHEAEFEEIATLNDQFAAMNARLAISEKKAQENLRLATIGAVASQVAHDIRSPLAALDMVVKQTSDLPEENRLLIRRAVQRIRDIANDLSRKKQDPSKQNCATSPNEVMTVQLLSGLIDTLVSEKRLQYRDRIGIEIESHLDESSYGLFASIQAVEFKRVLSNLINNAVEVLAHNGKVEVKLFGGESVTLSVADNGKGIPADILPKLMRRGETHGKSGGSGLGLYHARTSVEKWGGKMKIDSAPDRGTTITLTLPKSQSPAWFVAELVMQEHGEVVIIDDDDSIHQIWKQRFDEYRVQYYLALFHFSSPEEFILWQHEHPAQEKRLYLCDYEFLNHKKTGLDIIKEMKIAQQSILVTSRFEEANVSEGCQRFGVRLMPKNLAGFVPISISLPASDQSQEQKKIERSDHAHLNINLQVSSAHDLQNHSVPDAILIDDDDLVHINWKMAAKRKNKILRVYTGPEPFWEEAAGFPKNIPIYVDSNLAQGTKGEDVAWLLGKKGFDNLYLATGTNPDEFSNMPWLKGIIGKDPPWG